MQSQFVDTYRCLSSQLNYDGNPLTYRSWLRKSDNVKCAYLYLNFYSAVLSAWRKKSVFDYIDEAEAVSFCLKYLQKNVEKIKRDEARYTPNYVYTVCVNCMAILHFRKCSRERAEKETSSVVVSNGNEVDLFDFVSDSVAEKEYDVVDNEVDSTLFDLVRSLGVKYENVAYHLVSSQISLSKLGPRNKAKDVDPFAEVSVRKSDVPNILSRLRCECARYVVTKRPDLVDSLRGCVLSPEVQVV